MSKHGPITAAPMSWAECAAAGMSKAEAARHRGATDAAASDWQSRHGVKFVDGRTGAPRKRTQATLRRAVENRSALRNVTREVLAAVWLRHDISIQKIANTLGVSASVVYKKAKHFNLPLRGRVKNRIDEGLFSYLWTYGVSAADLAAHFGYEGRAQVYAKVKYLGLKRKMPGRAKQPTIQEGIDAQMAVKMRQSAEATKLAAAKRAKKARA